MTDRRPHDARRSASPQSSPGARSPKSGSRRRRSHPLLGLFPLTIMAVATFLVVFTLMMARLQAGADPVLRAGSASALSRSAASLSPITTRASAAAIPVAAPHASPGTTRSIVTRSSAGIAGVSHDD